MRHALGDHQHEYRIGQKDSDVERYLLSGVRGQPEREAAKDVQPETGEYDVKNVVQNSTLHYYDNCNIWVNLAADWILNLVTRDGVTSQEPLSV